MYISKIIFIFLLKQKTVSQIVIMFQNYTVFTVFFHQINKALMSIRYFLQNSIFFFITNFNAVVDSFRFWNSSFLPLFMALLYGYYLFLLTTAKWYLSYIYIYIYIYIYTHIHTHTHTLGVSMLTHAINKQKKITQIKSHYKVWPQLLAVIAARKVIYHVLWVLPG